MKLFQGTVCSDILLQAQFHPQKFVALEALSATGLRSIRYANEIPELKCVFQLQLT